MANIFKSFPASQIPTAGYPVYTVPALSQAIGVGLVISNTSKNPYSANVTITRLGQNFSVVTGAIVPVGGSLVVSGVDQKLVLQDNDTVTITPSANNCCDVWLSILEMTPTSGIL
jgi:hypothetical protein